MNARPRVPSGSPRSSHNQNVDMTKLLDVIMAYMLFQGHQPALQAGQPIRNTSATTWEASILRKNS